MGKSYDVIVIGGGPAGYHAAIRAAQLGLNTACIERWKNPAGKNVLGGTCLNVGCIPTKTLLDISHKYDEAANGFEELGIDSGSPSVDIARMMEHKERIVGNLTRGVGALFKSNGVTTLWGTGKIESEGQITYQSEEGEPEQLSADHIIIATGSMPAAIDSSPFTGDLIVDSTGALQFPRAPSRLGIIGAGVIGLELGSIWNRLGSDVIILEMLPDFLPTNDRQLAREALRQLTKQGMQIRLGANVNRSEVVGHEVRVSYSDAKGEHTEIFDKLIVAVGRKPCIDGLLGLNSGIELDERGRIKVDHLCRTSVPNIYAAGDVVRGPMLAHKGMAEGVMVAENIAGQNAEVNYECVPSVIYTNPEIASVGLTQEQLDADNRAYKSGSFPFAASGRAMAANQTNGFVKVIADAESDQILGAHMIGPQASELISEAVIAMEFGGTAEDIDLTMFAHPTLSENFHEAALALGGKAIHIANRKKRERKQE